MSLNPAAAVVGLFACLFVFMKLVVPEFGTYMFRIATSSRLTVPLIRLVCPSLSLLTSFSLKFPLSDYSITSLCLPSVLGCRLEYLCHGAVGDNRIR